MNTGIDLNALRRGGGARSSVSAMPDSMVSPPPRVVIRYILPMTLLAAFVAVVGFSMRGSLVRPTPVRIVMPMLGEVAGDAAGAPLFQALGWVEPYPLPTVISSRTPGVVLQVHVLEGQQVSQGDLVAELVDTDARLQVEKAEAELLLKKAEYEAARSNWEHPIALRENVQTADAAKLQSMAEKLRGEQMLAVAKRDAEINESLSQRGVSPAFDALKATREAEAARADIAAANARIQLSEVALAAAKERLELRIEDKQKVAVAQAELRKAEVALSEAKYELSLRRIEAPTSGVVMRLYVSPGSMVSMDVEKGNQIAAMYDPSSLQVRAEVPLVEAAKIRDRLPVELRFEALPDRVFHGELARVVHEFDIQRNTLPVKVRVLDPDPALKPEMIGRLQFSSPQTAQAKPKGDLPQAVSTFIPANLVSADASEAKLWVVRSDSRASQQTVKLGRGRKGELREVVSGISPADKIIVAGTEGLKEGSRVTATHGEESHAD